MTPANSSAALVVGL